jgi:AcrR family transcriptional regulator
MVEAVQGQFTPRKTPVQTRSAVTVEAILDATLQVLLQAGKAKLTTTRVAARAGVSVGTLYQYFPNKSALLQAVLRRHIDKVAVAVERVSEEQRGATLEAMGTALVNGFLDAKMVDGRESVALYSVSADVDGARVVREFGVRWHAAIVAMLRSAREPLTVEPAVVAEILQGLLAGVSRRILEGRQSPEDVNALRRELGVIVRVYLRACTGVGVV